MTSHEAFELLRLPLMFGNPKQIAAVRFIEKVDAAQAEAEKCQLCYGQGAYMGAYELFRCGCVDDFSEDVLLALALRTNRRG